MTMLVLTEDQEILAANAREVIDAEAPVSRFRALRDRGEVLDSALWHDLVELGWPAIPFTEDDGGLGMGLPEVAVVMEALGRQLVATPMVSAVMAAVLDPQFGAQEGRILATAWREHPRLSDPALCGTIVRDGKLYGRKLAVLDGISAEAFVVSAKDGDTLRLFRVPADQVTVVPLVRVDHRDAADVVLDGAQGEPLEGGLDALVTALRHADVALASEHLGATEGVFALTRAYLHDRHQFDAPIGSFQVIQHRMVDLFVQLELTRSVVLQAAREPDASWVRMATIKSRETFLAVAKEAVQLHGGIGMTDECDVGFYVKRAMVAAFSAA